MRGWKISVSTDIAMRVLLQLNTIFVSDVCHVLPSEILAILSILNHSLNWPVPFARELNYRVDGGHANDVDKNRLNGTEARLFDRRTRDLAYQPNYPCHSNRTVQLPTTCFSLTLQIGSHKATEDTSC